MLLTLQLFSCHLSKIPDHVNTAANLIDARFVSLVEPDLLFMIKNLLLFTICASFMQTSLAQGWCQPGATWHYKHYFLGAFIGNFQSYSYIDGVSDFNYVNDTVINNITCNHIQATFQGRWYYWMQPAIVNNYRNFYTYQNNGVLYVLSGGVFDTIVNFNAAIGDKWRRNTLSSSLGGVLCNQRGVVTVTDTGRVQIYNLSLKKIVTSYTNTIINGNNTSTVNITDTIIERIMSRVGFMFPMYCEVNNPPVDAPAVYNGDFKCYEDDKFLLYKRVSVDKCEYNDAVGIAELSVHQIPVRLSPNPSAGSLVVESTQLAQQEPYTISIVNALGQCVYQQEAKALNGQLRLNPGHLGHGIYYLRIRNKNGLVALEKLVREN